MGIDIKRVCDRCGKEILEGAEFTTLKGRVYQYDIKRLCQKDSYNLLKKVQSLIYAKHVQKNCTSLFRERGKKNVLEEAETAVLQT